MKKIIPAIALVALATVCSFSQENDLKFGFRTGFNLYNVFGYKGPPSDLGMGFSYGAIANVPIISSLTFNPEVNLSFKSLNALNHTGVGERDIEATIPGGPLSGQTVLIEVEEAKVHRETNFTEVSIDIPLMLQFTPSNALPLYLTAGVQIGIPIYSEGWSIIELVEEIDREKIVVDLGTFGTHSVLNPNPNPMIASMAAQFIEQYTPKQGYRFEDKSINRKPVEFSAAFGLGYKINPNFAVDLRGNYMLTAFKGVKRSSDGKKSTRLEYGAGMLFYY